METDTYITETMKRFKLVDMREQYPALIREAEEKNLSYREFLINLLKTEAEGKSERKQQRLMDEAGFEYQKSLDQINYTFNPSLDPEKNPRTAYTAVYGRRREYPDYRSSRCRQDNDRNGNWHGSMSRRKESVVYECKRPDGSTDRIHAERDIENDFSGAAENSAADHRRAVLPENGQRKREPFLSGCPPEI